MGQPYANSGAVAARWRPLTDAEASVADTLLWDAAALIRARFPGIDSQVAAGTVDPAILALVSANMVKRAMVAPADGITQESDSMGPYSHAQTYANPLGNVFLTAAEATLILGYQPAGQSVGYANDTDACVPTYSRVYGW